MKTAARGPLNLVAELTYRCPLQCPYCSNPVALGDFRESLSAEDWGRVFREAAELGAVHVGLTGGEPSLRSDLETIVRHADQNGLYTHLVTAARPLTAEALAMLQSAGLRSVQISLQDSERENSDRIAGTESFQRKVDLCAATRELGLPLTLNVVLHRENLDRTAEIIALASELGANRLELANTQYLGWALKNRAALLPDEDQLRSAARAVEAARERHKDLEILFVLPDYFRDRPKACMGGWARQHLVITPDGRALPCHGAVELEALEFWNVQEKDLRSCWEDAPGMAAYRGEEWMRDPCRSCPDREKDHGGCRCQAFALTGDAANTDPVCSLSPQHEIISDARKAAPEPWSYRRT